MGLQSGVGYAEKSIRRRELRKRHVNDWGDNDNGLIKCFELGKLLRCKNTGANWIRNFKFAKQM